MSEVKLDLIPIMSAGKCVDTLSFMYSQVINNGVEISKMPSVMLWGPPGVGKSQAVKELAKELELNTKKKVKVTDVRLILFNPIDLRGIPTSNADKTLAVWLRPQIFQMEESKNVVNILFLDEISAAPQSVQAAAYQITLDRRIGEHMLPDNCIVIAAGNRTTDKSVAYAMPKALANRLLHLEIEPNFEAWNKWAISHGINEKVLGFLKFKPDYLIETDVKTSTLAYNTPRTWEMVSNLLNSLSGKFDTIYPLVAGLVGKGVALEFKSWISVYDCLPDIEGIFSGKETNIPMWTHYANEHTGICIEYDTKTIQKELTLNSLYPIRYTEKLLDGMSHIMDRQSNPLSAYSFLEELGTQKHKDWEYEQEWRLMLHMGHLYPSAESIPKEYRNKGQLYYFTKPSKVILGCKISEQNEKLLRGVCKNAGVDIVKMQITPYGLMY